MAWGEGQSIKTDFSAEEAMRAGTRMVGHNYTKVNPENTEEINSPTILARDQWHCREMPQLTKLT